MSSLDRACRKLCGKMCRGTRRRARDGCQGDRRGTRNSGYLPGADHGDETIAQRALDVISWDFSVPKDRVKIKIEKGWVTLRGDVDWRFQSQAAEADIRSLFGVMGVSNAIEIKPRVQVLDVEKQIRAAFRRNAEFEAENIVVTADGRTVTLTGQVGSYHERTLAADTAWSAPGVTQVHDLLTVD
jgi:osmotically-inducible protein OsmY